MKTYFSKHTYLTLGFFLLLSTFIMVYGCQKKRHRDGITGPAETSSNVVSLRLAKTSAGTLTVSITDNESNEIVDSETFLNPTFPVNTSLEAEVPPCDFTITAQMTLPSGLIDSDSTTINACEYAGGKIALTVLSEDPTHPLTVNKTGSGTGTVTSNDGTIDCGGICERDFLKGTVVTLTAIPDTGSIFTGWSDGCSGTGACTVTINAATTVTAQFTAEYSLDVTKTGSGTGTVTSNVGAINCGGTCSDVYTNGEVVTLTAAPDPGSVFLRWSGGGCSGTGACTVTMTGAVAVTAQFTAEYGLDVTKTGSGTGTVTSNAGTINCGATCNDIYTDGQVVTLTATPDPGSAFLGWSGGCSGTGACTVTMTGAVAVTAQFDAEWTVAVNITGTGSGAVGGAGTYLQGMLVNLTATPDPGSVFQGWSGVVCNAGQTTSPCEFTITADTTVTAQFDAEWTVTVNTTGTGSGTVTGAGTYLQGTLVSLAATANPGSVFVDWSGVVCNAGQTTSPCEFTLTTDTTVTAQFDLFTCTGLLYGGYCFYLGALGESCDVVCGNVGGTCDQTGTNWARLTAVDCEYLMNTWGMLPELGDGADLAGNSALGCYAYDGTTYWDWLRGTPPPDATCFDSDSVSRRACACQ